MPKLPRGMFKRRGRGYYTRRWVEGRDCWVALGADFDEACRKLRALEKREVPVANLSVKVAAQKWLETYVATNRSEKNRGMAAQRVRDYFEPFMGYKLLAGREGRPAGDAPVAGEAGQEVADGPAHPGGREVLLPVV